MKKAILSLIFLGITFFGFTQDNQSSDSSNPKYIHKLGLHAGSTSGLGMSYKMLIKNKWMVQFVTLPVASKDYKYINSGLSLKYKVQDLDFWDFYVYGTGNYNFMQNGNYDYVYEPDYVEIFKGYEYEHRVNSSTGFSIEYGKGEFFKVSAQVGYGVYSIGTENWATNIAGGITLDFSLNSK